MNLKRILLCLLAMSSIIAAQGQTLIKYDPGNRSLIPFDQPFYLQVDSIKSSNIDSVLVYEIRYEKKKRKLWDAQYPNAVRPSFNVLPKDYTLSGTSVKITFPALGPDRDFDALVLCHFSTAHLKQALKVNQDIFLNPNQTSATWQPNGDLYKEYMVLYADVNKQPYNAANPRIVFPYSLPQYASTVYTSVQALYNQVINVPANLKSLSNFTQGEIDHLYKHMEQDIAVTYHLAALQNIESDHELSRVAKGLLPANYHLPVVAFKSEDAFDFDKRIVNLTNSITFVDSLDHALGLIKNNDAADFSTIRSRLRTWADTLSYNRKFIQDNFKQIVKNLTNLGYEAYWASQGTSVPDIKTAGTRHVTLDAGFMNIGVSDNSGHYVNISKLFFGLNFYFISIDKNVDWSRIPVPSPSGSDGTHTLESRNSPLQRLSLTAGFTLGSMQNKDFDNVYNGFSFAIGPSYRITKYLRLSAGAALLKRFNTDPLRTNSTLTVGNYVSLSLDYDLLSVASNITSALLK